MRTRSMTEAEVKAKPITHKTRPVSNSSKAQAKRYITHNVLQRKTKQGRKESQLKNQHKKSQQEKKSPQWTDKQ